MHKFQLAYNENLKHLQSGKGMLPLFDAGYITMGRQYLTIGVNGLVEAAEFLGIEISDNPQYAAFVQDVLGIVEKYNKQYRTADVLFNCEMIPAENVGVKHAKWDREDGYVVPRDCYNSYFYAVEDPSLNVLDKFRLHGRRYVEHLTGGSALHMNLDEHLSKAQYRQLLRVAAPRGDELSHVQHPEHRLQRLRPHRQALPERMPRLPQPQHGLSDARDRLPEAREQLLEAASERGRRTPLQPCCRRDGNRSGRRNRNHPDIMLKYAGYDIVFQRNSRRGDARAEPARAARTDAPGATVPICNGTRERR